MCDLDNVDYDIDSSDFEEDYEIEDGENEEDLVMERTKQSRFYNREVAKETSSLIRDKAKEWGEANFDEEKFTRKELGILVTFTMSLIQEGFLVKAGGQGGTNQ